MFKLALVQTDTYLGEKRKNLERLRQFCYTAKQEGAELICFPELATTGYAPTLLGQEYRALSETRQGETDRMFSALATELGVIIIFGFIKRDVQTNAVYNAAGVWLPGQESWLWVFRKMHLIQEEKRWFTPGQHLPVFDTPLGRIGGMICYDAGFPEVARCLTLKQADFLLLLSAWPEKDKDIWYINGPCRALENTVYLAAVNRWGREGDCQLFGGSQILNPRGQVMARATEHGEQILYHILDGQTQSAIRNTLPYLADRQPDYYR